MTTDVVRTYRNLRVWQRGIAVVEFRNFLSIAQWSISELETELEIATRLREALAKRIAVQAKAPRN